MTHVLLVSKIARTIGRELGLNEDLIEAAALGHDLGHTPLGHEGERILSEISIKNQEGYFNHNVQSIRNLMFLEKHGEGLNVAVQVLDAILCHNGEETERKYIPRKKTTEEFLSEYYNSYQDSRILKTLHPMTLEGCVVRISDVISYLGKDIEDAVRMGKITWEEIPNEIKQALGYSSTEIINNCIEDVVENSYGKDYIGLSKRTYEMFDRLLKFNTSRIYIPNWSKQELEKMKIVFNTIFDAYLSDLRTENFSSPIVGDYLAGMSEIYQRENSRERIAIDYIAGMTDSFLIKEYTRVRTLKR